MAGMKKINLAITGSKGFLGNYLTNYFSKFSKFNIISLSSSVDQKDLYYYSIGNPINEVILREIKIIILCAHDFTQEDVNFQKKGVDVIYNQIKKMNLKIKIIYISSLAAFKDAHSTYGKSKFLMEKIVIQNNGIIIKPGIIYGNKNIRGLINKIISFADKYRIVPYFVNLNSKIYLSHIEDLSNCIKEIINNENKGTFLCVNLNSYSFKELIYKFNKGKKIILIPMIWQLVYLIIKMLEFLKFNIGFRSDSILSLARQNKKPRDATLISYTKLFRN